MASRLVRSHSPDTAGASFSIRTAADRRPNLVPPPELPSDDAEFEAGRAGREERSAAPYPDRRAMPKKLRPGLY